MGANMARNLKDKGYQVSCVNDVAKDVASSLAEELNCAHAETLAEVTANSDVVLTVVTNDAAMDAIFFGEGDNLFTNASGKLFINCATLSPDMHVKLEGAAAEAGCETLEGCMASSITQAREGTLYLMIGGKQEVFENVKDLLDDLSISLRFLGEAGRAAQVKALVNMVMNINTATWPKVWERRCWGSTMLCDLFPDRGNPRFGNRCRGHADPGSRMLFFRRTCGQ